MTALAALDTADAVPADAVPAPVDLRPVHLSQVRPWDRIAFRMPESATGADEPDTGPALVWPRAVAADLPEPGAWCGTLVRTVVEVLLGARAPAQLARWLTTDLYTNLSHRATTGGATRPDARRVRVLRVHTCRVDEAHHESAVVFHDGRRVRAAAIRIEIHRARWRATALEIA